MRQLRSNDEDVSEGLFFCSNSNKKSLNFYSLKAIAIFEHFAWYKLFKSFLLYLSSVSISYFFVGEVLLGESLLSAIFLIFLPEANYLSLFRMDPLAFFIPNLMEPASFRDPVFVGESQTNELLVAVFLFLIRLLFTNCIDPFELIPSFFT